MRTLVFTCLTFLFFSACTEKETIYREEHVNVIIDDNTPPPYAEVTLVQVQTYINRLYIDLLGREPLNTELAEDTDLLKNNDLSLAARNQLFDQLMDTEAYYARIFEIYSAAYLNRVDRVQIDGEIQTYEFLISQAEQTGEYVLAQYYEFERNKFIALRDAPEDYQNASITINDFMERLCYNNFYDQINMGSENFVLSCFENFLKRFPTDNELNAGIAMVDGFSSQILLEEGTNQIDFIKIIMNTPGFYEGLTVDLYQQLLARNPDSEEMTAATLELSDNSDYQALQKKVLASEEYAGF